MKKSIVCVFVSVLQSMLSAVCLGGVADFALVRDGKPVAAFEIAPSADAKAADAAAGDIALFNRYLKEVSGAELPVSSTGSRGTVLRKKVRIELAEIRDLLVRYDWRIEFPSRDEMVVSATTTSLFAALRHLLEEGCDARFLGAEKCMFQYEPRKDVSVPARMVRSAKRNFSLYRALSVKTGHSREMGIEGDRLFEFSHGIPIYAFPHRRYNREGWPAEVMPVLGGKRLVKPAMPFTRWQPCYSKPETARMAVSNIVSSLRALPGKKSITLAVNDCGVYCECEACRAMDAGAEKSIFSNDKENRSASYFTFANRVIGEVEKEFPDLVYGVLAYTGTIMPPGFPVNRKIVPMMTFTTLASAMDSEVGALQDDVIRRWGEKVDMTGIWEYDWGRSFYVPRVDFAGSARRLKFLHENGGRAYFAENFHDMLDGPKVYLKTRLLEDIDRNADAVLDEWYDRFAGKAAAGVLRRLYGRCEEFWRSDSMKKSAFWRMRRCVCISPSDQVFQAIERGFTEDLVGMARKVRELADTAGGRRRAEILVRHFELLDCIASFRGSAWQTPFEGEVPSAKAAVGMLEEFTARAPVLFRAWGRVDAYFRNADFDDPGIYVNRKRKPVSLDPVAECAVMAAQALRFSDDPKVAAALGRVAGLQCLPDGVRGVFLTCAAENAENAFSNPGFRRPLSSMALYPQKDCVVETVAREDCEGGLAVRVVPRKPGGYAECRFTERLEPGAWLVTAKIRGCRRAELAVRRQKDGRNREDGVFAHCAVPRGEWRKFVKIGRVLPGTDGLNVVPRGVGVDASGMLVGDIRIVRLTAND